MVRKPLDLKVHCLSSCLTLLSDPSRSCPSEISSQWQISIKRSLLSQCFPAAKARFCFLIRRYVLALWFGHEVARFFTFPPPMLLLRLSSPSFPFELPVIFPFPSGPSSFLPSSSNPSRLPFSINLQPRIPLWWNRSPSLAINIMGLTELPSRSPTELSSWALASWGWSHNRSTPGGQSAKVVLTSSEARTKRGQENCKLRTDYEQGSNLSSVKG